MKCIGGIAVFLSLCSIVDIYFVPTLAQLDRRTMEHTEDNNEVGKSHTRNLNEKQPTARFLGPLFKVVKFENVVCSTTSTELGSCYSKSECASLNGTVYGTCALGFGVCCVTSQGCGGSSLANNTYFLGPSTMGASPGFCKFTIKGDGNICQFRLNFELFNIAPPSSPSSGLCLQDQFTVIGSVSKVPVICGFNDGQHIIFDTNGRGDDIDLVITGSNTFAQRQWKIRIIKYCCNDPHLAPRGCLQYFTGLTGTIQSFNFMTDYKSNYLALMGYSMCIRNEVGFCGICYTQCLTHDRGTFALSGDTKGSSINNKIPLSVSAKHCEVDFLLIPCGGTTASSTTPCGADRFCGGALSSSASVQTGGSPVCSVQQPFSIGFFTDDKSDTLVNYSGFCLNYTQQACSMR